jgi:hypothetical protein
LRISDHGINCSGKMSNCQSRHSAQIYQAFLDSPNLSRLKTHPDHPNPSTTACLEAQVFPSYLFVLSIFTDSVHFRSFAFFSYP